MSDMLLEMNGITKRFPGVTANDGISLDLRAGEVHALVGENGAGKTTLMKILYGLTRPDAGTISVRGERDLHPRTPRRHPPRHRHGAPALHAPAALLRAREHHPGGGVAHGRGARPRGPAARDLRVHGGEQARRGPRRPGGGPVRRRAAAGGDPEDPLPRRERSSSSTSPPPCSPRRRSRSCSGPSARSRGRARASSSSATSWTRCSRSPTGSP